MRKRWLFVGVLAACTLWLVTPALVAAQINIGINIGTPPPPPPPLMIATPPQLVVIPGTQVFYAPAVPQNYFIYGRKSYVFHDGAWFVAPTHHGPWTFLAVERVPPPSAVCLSVTTRSLPAITRTNTQTNKHHKHHKHDD